MLFFVLVKYDIEFNFTSEIPLRKSVSTKKLIESPLEEGKLDISTKYRKKWTGLMHTKLWSEYFDGSIFRLSC